MLLAVFLSTFSDAGFSFAHAQATISKTPALTSQGSYLNGMSRKNSSHVDKGKAVTAQTTGTHKITYFQGNKAGAISVTFDDGYTSQATTVFLSLTRVD